MCAYGKLEVWGMLVSECSILDACFIQQMGIRGILLHSPSQNKNTP